MCPPDVVDVRSYEDEQGYICAQGAPEYVYFLTLITSGGILLVFLDEFLQPVCLATAFNTPTFSFLAYIEPILSSTTSGYSRFVFLEDASERY